MLALCLSGCVTASDVSGPVSRQFGLISLQPIDTGDKDVSRLRQSVLGVWSSDAPTGSYGIGWRHQDVFTFSADCKLIFVFENTQDARTAIDMIRAEFDKGDGVCIANGD